MSLTFNQTDNSYCNNNALREQSESNTAYTNSYNLHESYVSNVKQHTFSRSECAFRKGKWTIEEEKYTNKVIECFKAGSLQLTGSDKHKTLRTYLAEKLNCDPMRITKKFSGASCLGKHIYKQERLSNLLIETTLRDRHELDQLENEFLSKLQQDETIKVHHKRSTKFNNCVATNTSTPAIDAFIMQQSLPRTITDSSSSSDDYSPFLNVLSNATNVQSDQYVNQLTNEANIVLKRHYPTSFICSNGHESQNNRVCPNGVSDNSRCGKFQRMEMSSAFGSVFPRTDTTVTDIPLGPAIVSIGEDTRIGLSTETYVPLPVIELYGLTAGSASALNVDTPTTPHYSPRHSEYLTSSSPQQQQAKRIRVGSERYCDASNASTANDVEVDIATSALIELNSSSGPNSASSAPIARDNDSREDLKCFLEGALRSSSTTQSNEE